MSLVDKIKRTLGMDGEQATADGGSGDDGSSDDAADA